MSTGNIDVDELRAEAAKLHWFHPIDLGHGIVTPGKRITPYDVDRMGIPRDLTGLSVLDIGAWDGYWSILCKQRGAARVLATDSFCWSDQSPTSKEGFLLARRALGLDVEDEFIDVMDLSPERIGTFDLVLCLGVLYHLRDPITAIERVASVTRGHLILETETALRWLRTPSARLFPADELYLDDTNWWSLNEAAVLGLLRTNGFTRAEVYSRMNPYRRLRRAGVRTWPKLPRRQLLERIRSQRTVFHAWKDRLD